MKTTPITKRIVVLSTALVMSLTSSLSLAQDQSWVERSNEYSQLYLNLIAKYGPEGAAGFGVEGYDDQIFNLTRENNEAQKADSEALIATYREALASETDVKVAQDLNILIRSLEDGLISTELNERLMLPYFNPAQGIFFGLQSLLNPQNDPARYPAAVERLKKYTGLEAGYIPVVDQAKAVISEGLENAALAGPYVGQLDRHIAGSEQMLSGIRGMLEGANLEGWEEPFAVFEEQMRDYYQWLGENVRPRANPSTLLPPEIYADNLKNFGVTISPDELIQRGTMAFRDIQNEMMALAPLLAAEKGWAETDYRDVIRRLKEDNVPGDKVIDLYRGALADLEEIIEREGLVTLPARDADIEIAGEAESIAIPAAHLRPPRLVGNTGEFPVFVIPMIFKNDDGSWQTNDTTFVANAPTLTAHEARPGHELQFSAMIEAGVSTARALFAFNSANVEGWALYAEAIAKPYMALDGQLISLQNRLARAARMFLDPMINLGQISVEDAKRVLLEDVVLGEGWAQSEVERYSFRAPGQATSYYFGYGHLQSLRTQVEVAMKDRFNQQAYHDFILAQGLLPPELLKNAVMTDFVGAGDM